ncbi:unnamed protein product [Paramecium octaurelia]|uniref:PSI domain-containing protein n=1 Tax=Paramecium octaurelia TaxID=43137 RepID=A0A8S1U5S7_PAROT|nr:unnamed protein product [Paramecium octaurelia]
MKIIVILLLFSISYVFAGTLTKTDACICKQILSQNDCATQNDCQWNSVSGLCETRKSTDIESYCSQSTTCPITGCAFYNKKCKPFSGCTVYIATTHADCQAISPLCTSNGEKCITVSATCDEYLVQIACQINTQQYPCFWDSQNSKCQEIASCDQFPTTYDSHEKCQSMGVLKSIKCTAKETGGCINIEDDCTKYTEKGCVVNSLGNSCFWDNAACKEKTCVNAPTTYNTQAQCKQYMSTCSVNENMAGCIDSPSSCENYTKEGQCVSVNGQICFWFSITCSEGQQNCTASSGCKVWSCENALSTTNTDQLCQQFKSECTVNATNTGCIKRATACNLYTTQNQCVKTLDESQKCYWNGTGCVSMSCTNAVLTTYNESNCSKFMPTCTLVNDKCGVRTCNTYPTEKLCSIDYQNQQCVWSGSCVLRTCQNAGDEYNTHNECQSWLTSCTVQNDLTGCQTQELTCPKYLKQEQCYKANNNAIQCLWIDNKCVQKTCNTASTLTSTDDECNIYLGGCMINNNQAGCVARKTNCSDLLSFQCTFTLSGQLCFWNGTQCVDRTCTQAKYNTYRACTTFLSSCTVSYTGTNFDGCTSKQQLCSDYQYEQNCIESLTDGKCIWNKKASPNACQVRTCANSDQTTSDAACNNHLSTCTVNVAKTGCIERYDKCSLFTSQINCIKNLTGGECLWYNNACTDRTCDKADKTFTTHDACQSYSSKCTTNGKGCINIDICTSYTLKSGCIVDKNNRNCAFQPSCNVLQCSDAPQSYSTDQDCRNFKSECTTNGSGCVLRTTCTDAYIQEACVTDSSNNKCAWINNRCVNFGCSSAPSKYVTEKECQLYKQGCTVNQSGGCIQKGTCKDAKIQAACTTDKDGNECEFSAAGCRDKVCSDYTFTTHKECQAAKSTCTTDGTKCVNQQNCSLKTKSGCFYGSDGPCLWINNACYAYTSCQSLIFSDHTSCYSFSNECTTDGISCIAIDKCANLAEQSCYQGTDGRCVYSPDSLNGQSKCKVYDGCKSAFFNTHVQCQLVDATCTTDEASCIDLQDCTSYTKQSTCNIDQKNNKCYYDDKEKKCVQLECKYITLTTHQECNDQLSTCTTDNTKCITMGKCETYAKDYCNTSLGTDGKCLYDPNVVKCRLALCTELNDNCSQISNCVDSGIGCVVKATCDKYETEIACKQGGSDGLCVWYLNNGEGACKLMTSCSDGSSNKEACTQKSWNCQWTETSTQTACAQHTCSSKYKETGICQPILDFEQKNYELCALTSSQCISMEFASLIQSNCFQATAYTYTWDSVNSKCLKCGTTFTNNTNNQSNNSNNDTNQTDTNSQSPIIFTFIIMIISIYI